MLGGRFACGRVLQLNGSETPTPTRAFFGGLHNWTGSALPVEADLAGADYAAFGVMHILTILRTGGAILGERSLELDGFCLPLFLSAHAGHETRVLSGANYLRDAVAEDLGQFPVLSYWGYDFMQAIAEQRFGSAIA